MVEGWKTSLLPEAPCTSSGRKNISRTGPVMIRKRRGNHLAIITGHRSLSPVLMERWVGGITLIALTNKKYEKGFTLIELMIVMAIIGLLAAIAIPQFSAYRTRSFNSAAVADLRNAMGAQEVYYVNHQVYANSASDLIGSYGLTYTPNVSLTLTVTGSSTGYTLISYHSSGDTTYTIRGPGGQIRGN
jgi:prepilin-type N-terminal cleavage/methylation domain-containing protein